MAPNSPSFTSTVSAITDAFGDPTRRGIYLMARDREQGVTAAQVAEQFGVHPNVARHHLDKLSAGGYLEVVIERAEGAGAGRPSQALPRAGRRPCRHGRRAGAAATTSCCRCWAGRCGCCRASRPKLMAEEVGQEYGKAMALGMTGADLAAGQRSLRSAMQAVADALTAHGFAAHADQRNNQLRIINNHCPFGDVAIEHPVICAVDRGMVKGMLAALYGDADVSTLQSLAQGDTFCATSV